MAVPPFPIPETHVQKFKIKHTFRVAPFATAPQINNFRNINPVDYFKDGKALKYICKVDGKFNFSDPNIPHTGKLTDNNGLTNWFNQNNIRSRAEYYFESIEMLDASTGDACDAIDIEHRVICTIIIKSRSGKVTIDGTEVAIDFCYIPLNESRYVYTPETTLRQNFMNDRIFLLVGNSGLSDFYGTEYQVIYGAEVTYVDTETLSIRIDTEFSAELQAFLKTLPEDNRNYFFSITTQADTISTTMQSDNVPVLVPINQIGWNQTNPNLLEAVDNLRAYHFPAIDSNEKNTIGGWEGDPFYVQFPFLLETVESDDVTPTLLNAGFQIVAAKDGEDDFVLEEKIFDTSLIRKLDGVQTIDISESRNYRDMPDEYNTVSLVRDDSYDDGTMKGYLSHYAGVLRYEFWSKLISDSERFQYALFTEVENPTNAWNTLQQNGWELKVRFVANVQGYTGATDTFDQYWDIDCKAVGDEPDQTPLFTSEVKYYDYETGVEVGGIVKGGKTLIVRTYIGNFSLLPEGYEDLFAYIFADIENTGGVNSRRFASSEFDSEDDSPFTADEADPEASQSWASANLRVNIYNFAKVTASCIYDETETPTTTRTSSGLSTRSNAMLIYPKLGGFQGCFILVETGDYALDENDQRIQAETCGQEEEEIIV